VAFYAKRWNGIEYPTARCYHQTQKGKRLDRASAIRIFHGFGLSTIAWSNETYDVATGTNHRDRSLNPYGNVVGSSSLVK
jgi:hypothetical protein